MQHQDMLCSLGLLIATSHNLAEDLKRKTGEWSISRRTSAAGARLDQQGTDAVKLAAAEQFPETIQRR